MFVGKKIFTRVNDCCQRQSKKIETTYIIMSLHYSFKPDSKTVSSAIKLVVFLSGVVFRASYIAAI